MIVEKIAVCEPNVICIRMCKVRKNNIQVKDCQKWEVGGCHRPFLMRVVTKPAWLLSHCRGALVCLGPSRDLITVWEGQMLKSKPAALHPTALTLILSTIKGIPHFLGLFFSFNLASSDVWKIFVILNESFIPTCKFYKIGHYSICEFVVITSVMALDFQNGQFNVFLNFFIYSS